MFPLPISGHQQAGVLEELTELIRRTVIDGQCTLQDLVVQPSQLVGFRVVVGLEEKHVLGQVGGQAAGKVSGAHCTVTYVASEDRYRVVDLSSNGTYVESSRLPARTPVLVNRGAELMLADADNVVRLL